MKSDDYTTKKSDEHSSKKGEMEPTDKENLSKTWKTLKKIPGFGIFTGFLSMGLMVGALYTLYIESGLHEWLFEGPLPLDVILMESTSNISTELASIGPNTLVTLIAFMVVVSLLTMAFKIGFTFDSI